MDVSREGNGRPVRVEAARSHQPQELREDSAARPERLRAVAVAERDVATPANGRRESFRTPTVLILGDYRYALTHARSLRRVGYRTLIGGQSYVQYGRYSRHVSAYWPHPRIQNGGERFIDALDVFLAGHPEIDAIMPMGDREVDVLAAHAPRFPTNVRLVMPSPEVVRVCGDKLAMCRLASELGIPQAMFALASTLNELRYQVHDIGFPCVVKPADQLHRVFGQKAVILNTDADLARAFGQFPDVSAVLIQGFAAGKRRNVQIVARQGSIVCRFVTKTLRTDRLNDTGYTVEGITEAPRRDLDEYTNALVRKLGYEGPGCMQFLVDDWTGRVSFLELNPRLGAGFGIAAACGVNFSRMAVDVALGMELEQRDCADYPVGKRLAWTYGDLDGILHAWDKGAIGIGEGFRWFGRAAKAFVRADAHVSWSWKDPWPTLVAYTRLMLGLVRRLVFFRRRVRS